MNDTSDNSDTSVSCLCGKCYIRYSQVGFHCLLYLDLARFRNQIECLGCSNQGGSIGFKSARIKKLDNTLRSVCLNIQSIKNKRETLWNLLDSSNPDILFGCETWLNPNIICWSIDSCYNETIMSVAIDLACNKLTWGITIYWFIYYFSFDG
jgi:hypothetical protein